MSLVRLLAPAAFGLAVELPWGCGGRSTVGDSGTAAAGHCPAARFVDAGRGGGGAAGRNESDANAEAGGEGDGGDGGALGGLPPGGGASGAREAGGGGGGCATCAGGQGAEPGLEAGADGAGVLSCVACSVSYCSTELADCVGSQGCTEGLWCAATSCLTSADLGCLLGCFADPIAGLQALSLWTCLDDSCGADCLAGLTLQMGAGDSQP